MSKKVKKAARRPEHVETAPRRSKSGISRRPYVVKLKYNQPRVVQAKSEAGAWHKYKAMMGIRNSEHEPSITRAGPDLEYDAETGIIANIGVESAPDPDDDDEGDLDDEFEEDDD